MKDIIFFCDCYGRGALLGALFHLGAIEPDKTAIIQLYQLTWWKRINQLAPGQLLAVGRDARGNRVYVLWVPKDKELLPRLARSLEVATGRQGQIILVDALVKNNWKTNLARFLARFLGYNYLSHYLFLSGIRESHQRHHPVPNPSF